MPFSSTLKSLWSAIQFNTNLAPVKLCSVIEFAGNVLVWRQFVVVSTLRMCDQVQTCFVLRFWNESYSSRPRLNHHRAIVDTLNITPSEHQHPATSVRWWHLTQSAAVAHYSFTELQPCLTLTEWIQSQLDSCRHHGHVVLLFILFFWSLLGGVFRGLLSQVSVNALTQHRLYSLKIRTVCALVDAKNMIYIYI